MTSVRLLEISIEYIGKAPEPKTIEPLGKQL